MNATSWFVIFATCAVFAVWLGVNIFLVAVEGVSEGVPLSSRRNWGGRINTAMLIVPVIAGAGTALLSH